MKNSFLLILTITLLLSSCDTNMPERTIGFVTGENAELQWHLGTQEAIDVVTTVDQLWTNQDYEAMRPFFADSVEVWRPNGVYTNTFDSFVESLSNGSNVTWSLNYAFSVDLDPSTGGEHVQAGFVITYPATEESEERVDYQHESYYVVDGKIITLNQYSIRNAQQD
jgi:hypothetical protein